LQKIVSILFVVAFLFSCTVSRTVSRNKTERISAGENGIELNDVISNNITEQAFFIEKAEVEIINQCERKRFFISVKYSLPDSFLISLRSLSGIEAARIFLTEDSILVNDRINKILYQGTQLDAKRKYGFNTEIFPVLLGDLVVEKTGESFTMNSEKEYELIISSNSGNKFEYSVDYRILKVVKAVISRNNKSKPVLIKYDSFRKFSNIVLPSQIYMYNVNGIEEITLKIIKIQAPWKGRIEFIPGSNYEKIELR